MTSSSRSGTALLSFSIFVGLCWSLLYAQFTVDDSFIFFRYGHTLIHHHVWNWNPTGAHVEAYTSTLYAILSVVPALLHVSPLLFFKLIGLASLLMIVFLIQKGGTSRNNKLFATIVLLAHPYVWIHVYSCLETPVFMLLIVWLALAAVRAEALGVLSDIRVVYIVAFLLPITRPEGIVFSLVGLAIFMRTNRPSNLRLGYITSLVLLGVIYFVVRWRYFGALLPNPYYVKVAHGNISTFLGNASSVQLLLLTLVACVFVNRLPMFRILWAAAALIIVLVYLPHYLAMNYSDRFVFQICLPMLVVAIATAKPNDKPSPILDSELLLIALLFLLTWNLGELRSVIRSYPYLESAHVRLGRSLAPFAKGHSLLGGDMGAVPYYSDWQAYDYLGLCSNEVAHHGLTTNFIETANPDLILLYAKDSQPTFNSTPQQEMIGDYMKSKGDYTYIGAVRWSDFYVAEFLRTNTSEFSQISAALKAADEQNRKYHYGPSELPGILEQRYLWREITNSAP